MRGGPTKGTPKTAIFTILAFQFVREPTAFKKIVKTALDPTTPMFCEPRPNCFASDSLAGGGHRMVQGQGVLVQLCGEGGSLRAGGNVEPEGQCQWDNTAA
jgi:hypothetical protein